ncbi:MAG: VWA domain-containing protein, partial [Vicinamibacterales bacterium]
LTRDDFDLFDADAPQTIAEFTRFSATRGPAITTARPDVRTLNESRDLLADGSGRVFVLFLDRPHVDRAAAMRIRKPLVDSLDRLIGADDLVAVMTPDMNPRDLTFVRRAASVDSMLGQRWGTRDEVNFTDPVEQMFAACYPGMTSSEQGVAQEMILRRRERQTLDALDALIQRLRGVREERKAVIAISNGWRLFTPNPSLARIVDGRVPSGRPVTVDPRNGRLTTNGSPDTAGAGACDAERQALAALDEPPRFRQILDDANRGNVSFYPVDPRGLVTFDEDIVPAAGVGALLLNPTVPIDQDLRRLSERHDSLRLMADSTDGLAIIENSNLAAGLRRVADDLSTYYLLGYYSTTRLDGKFHSIRVRVKRPGIQVRARRGYLAARADAVTTVAPTASASGVAEAALVSSAMESLGAAVGETALRVRAAAAYTPAGTVAVSLVADGARGSGGGSEWAPGGEADAMVIDTAGTQVALQHATIAPGTTGLRIVMTAAALPPGEYELRLREKGAGSAAASTASTRFTVKAAPAGTGAVVYRRGPTTGNRDVPTADLR